MFSVQRFSLYHIGNTSIVNYKSSKNNTAQGNNCRLFRDPHENKYTVCAEHTTFSVQAGGT